MAKYSVMKDGVCENVIEWDPIKAPNITWPDGVTVVPHDLSHEALRPVPEYAPETVPDLYKQVIKDEIMKSAEFKQLIADEVARVKPV